MNRMIEFVEQYNRKTFITDMFLMTTDFTYEQLYAIANYKKERW